MMLHLRKWTKTAVGGGDHSKVYCSVALLVSFGVLWLSTSADHANLHIGQTQNESNMPLAFTTWLVTQTKGIQLIVYFEANGNIDFSIRLKKWSKNGPVSIWRDFHCRFQVRKSVHCNSWLLPFSLSILYKIFGCCLTHTWHPHGTPFMTAVKTANAKKSLFLMINREIEIIKQFIRFIWRYKEKNA